jgi:hypothetical protein
MSALAALKPPRLSGRVTACHPTRRFTPAALNAASCAESGCSYRQRASAYSLEKAMEMDARIRSLDQAAAILRE